MKPQTKFVALVAAALLGLLALAGCGAAVAPSNEQPHTLTVTGNGAAYGKPDVATVNLGVQTRNTDAGKAVDENTQKMSTIIATLKELGIDEKDIQTSNFSISAQPDYTPEGQPAGTFTYVVDNSATVIVRDLTKVGTTLSQVVAKGANSIYGVNFSVSDPAALEGQARDKAMADARVRAEQMAKAAGVTLDKPLSISEYTSGPIPYAADFKAAPMASGAPVPIASGQVQINLQVSVTYIIK